MFSPTFPKSIWDFDSNNNNNNNNCLASINKMVSDTLTSPQSTQANNLFNIPNLLGPDDSLNVFQNNNNNGFANITKMLSSSTLNSQQSFQTNNTFNNLYNISNFSHGPEESVNVKSCAHVSFIVGKQGKKIREIRRMTNTYIETPVNGESPVFRIRGTHSNIAAAKALIEKSALEFDNELYQETQVPSIDGNERYNLYLPARFIGLVVGRQGYCIKKIMQVCDVVIITPKINTLNLFKITGKRANVFAAIQDIKKHIQESINSDVEVLPRNDREFQLDVIVRYTI